MAASGGENLRRFDKSAAFAPSGASPQGGNSLKLLPVNPPERATIKKNRHYASSAGFFVFNFSLVSPA